MRDKLKSKIAENLQKALNRYLALDPESAKRLVPLQNKIVLIDISGINEKLFLHFSEQGIALLTDENVVPDAVIKGTPLRLLHLSLSQTTRQQVLSDDVTITGNLEVGQQVIRLFDEMEIDWEEQLSKFIGDATAYRLGNFTRRIKDWIENSKNTLLQDINDYIHEEKKLAPSAEALKDFYEDIDTLRMDADRVAARIQQLEKQISERGQQ